MNVIEKSRILLKEVSSALNVSTEQALKATEGFGSGHKRRLPWDVVHNSVLGCLPEDRYQDYARAQAVMLRKYLLSDEVYPDRVKFCWQTIHKLESYYG